MMESIKKGLLASTIAVLLVAVPSPARAALIVLEDKINYPYQNVTYDDLTGIYWYYHLEDLHGGTWSQQLDKVEALNSPGYFGFTDWRVANLEEMESLWDNYTMYEIADAFYTSERGSTFDEWRGRYDSVPPGTTGQHYEARINFNYRFGVYIKDPLETRIVDDDVTTPYLSVWAIGGTPSGVIPEPSTLIIWSLLGGLGLGVGWWRRN